MAKTLVLLLGVIVLAPTPCSWAAAPTAEEMADANRWVDVKFRGVEAPRPATPGLVVQANYGPIQQNVRDGNPLRIAEKTYPHGLYCHANSRILVRLPGPGRAFTAVAGMDTNGDYTGGSGVFSVAVAGKTEFTSPVMLRGQAGIQVVVALNGATEFILTVGDGGDNINSDQASWAEAAVTLADGSLVRLGDLTLLPAEAAPITPEPPFSFLFEDTAFAKLLSGWTVERSEQPLDGRRTQYTLVYNGPANGLSIRCVAVAYRDFPTVEWTLYFKNTGEAPSGMISNIQALDTTFDGTPQNGFRLHHNNGTYVDRTDYQPLITELKPGATTSFTPRDGRPCAAAFPYFNVEMGDGGVIAAVGWPGKWAAAFTRDNAAGLRITAGQELTHFRLLPGEEVRTPLIVLQFWRDDYTRSQNIWRSWMVAHNIPRRDGQLPPPQMPAVSGNQFPGLLCNESDELRYIDRFEEEGIKLTHWWMDAGWYLNKGDWTSTGTWEVDKARFPKGIRAVADHAHQKGLKLIVWFEPERVTPGSWLAENHPEWVLGGKSGGLLNLGDPEAWDWLVNCYDKIITDEGIDYYRQDFNMDPLPYWRANDAGDRQGVTEIRHVEGYLAFWDELVRRHPALMIDSCASGGHRNDLETLRRALPLLRSDYLFDPLGEQCHTYGLASWVPFWGTGLIDYDLYLFRSCLGLNTTLSCDARRKDLDWELLRTLTAQWRELAPNFYGDYYPLTPYSLENDVWIAWQFNRPEVGEGMVQAFRRPDSIYESARLKLEDLVPGVQYLVHSMDEPGDTTMTGAELMDVGLPASLPNAPMALVWTYKKQP